MTAPAEVTEQAPATERRLSLYEITGELAALDDLLEETEGEVTPEIEAWMDEFAPKLKSKVDSIGRYVRSLESDAAACKEEESRLAARRKSREKKVDSLKKLLDIAMQRLGEPKLEGATFTVARQKNGGLRRLTLLCEPERMPPQYARSQVVTTWTVNQQLIRDHLGAAGEDALEAVDVDGQIREVARLEPPTYSVRIK